MLQAQSASGDRCLEGRGPWTRPACSRFLKEGNAAGRPDLPPKKQEAAVSCGHHEACSLGQQLQVRDSAPLNKVHPCLLIHALPCTSQRGKTVLSKLVTAGHGETGALDQAAHQALPCAAGDGRSPAMRCWL